MTSTNSPGNDFLARAILNVSLDCIIAIDESGHVVEWNPAAEHTFGYTRQEALERPLGKLIIPPEHQEAHIRGLQRYLATGEARVLNQRLRLQAQRRDGRVFPCELTIHHSETNGMPYFIAVLRDITEQEATQERAERLQRVTSALAGALTPEAVVAVILAEALPAIHADAGGVMLLDEDGTHLTAIGQSGFSEDMQRRFWRVPLEAPIPITDAVCARRPYFLTGADYLAQYPQLAAQRTLSGSGASLPLMVGDAVIGGLLLSFQEDREFSETERTFMISVAAQCAQALERARLYRAARASEERYRELLDNIPQIVWTVNREGRIERFNQRWTEFSHLPLTPTDEEWRDLIHPEDRTRSLEDRSRCIQAGEPYAYEERLRRFDGEYRWMLVQAHPVRNPETGELNGWVGGATDIHERKQTEQALRDREARYRALVENAAVGVAQTSPEGRWLDVNHAAEVFLGYSREELLTMTFQDVTHPDDRREGSSHPYRKLIAGEHDAFTIEKRYVRKDGQAVWATTTVSAVRDEAGVMQYAVAVLNDITQRKLAEEQLRASEERFRRLVDTSPTGMAVVAPDGTIRFPNDAYLRMRGFTREEFDANAVNWAELTAPEYREVDERAFRQAFERGRSDPYEKELLRRDGTRFPAELVLTWFAPHDETFVVAHVQDLTVQKAAERTLREHSAELERRVEERTRALEAQRTALDAFVTYTETVGTETDTLTLARQAIDVLASRFSNGSAAYYEPEGKVWKARVWTQDIRPDTVAVITAGLSAETPLFAATIQAREERFVNTWDAEREQIERTEQYDSAATYPLLVGGELTGLLVVGLKDTQHWSERDKALVRAVGRSLNLALERAHQAALLTAQNAELEARTNALEGFASLTRDLTLSSDPVALVRRAQEIVMSMLPDGHAAYYELDGDAWHLRTMVGEWGNPHLQAAVQQGLPYHTTRNFLLPWTTGEPHYQDVYDPGTDNLGGLVEHFAASAVLPVMVKGEPIGVLAVALFHQRCWTRMDKAVLESVVRHLGLALEGARSLAQLAERTRELERSNRDLEQFAYVASHDLQEPLRTVTSYTELLARRYQGQLDDKANQYIEFTVDAAKRMRDLVQDLLAFSRVRAGEQQLTLLDAGDVMQSVTRDLHETIRQSDATVTWDALPVVRADRVQFRQLLQNLVGNAIKFRRKDAPPSVHVSAEQEGNVYHFRVRDNGIGIEEAYFERIFGVFQRLHTHDRYEGTGVGLAICKRIVERHGGQLWVESRPGVGSTFHFTLPLPTGDAGGADD